MADTNTKAEIEANLRDAGCCQELIDRFLACHDRDALEAELALLVRHRAELLEDVHRCQKKVDCLDYLIYRLKKETK